ncbi:MAG: hypothetical protein IPJ46_23505 [Anaerolineales bacterium]|nr:hypothetical protein [Anaerolineales bacterium]
MKKIFYVLSLLIIASMVLTACGGGSAATEAPAAATEAPAATDAPAATEAPAGGDRSANRRPDPNHSSSSNNWRRRLRPGLHSGDLVRRSWWWFQC